MHGNVRLWGVRVGLALAALTMVACGPPWQVIRQSGPPSALQGVQGIGVQFDYSQISLGGKSEQVWLSAKSPEDQQKYQEVKQTIDQAYLSTLQQQLPNVAVTPGGMQPQPVMLTVQYTMMEQGKYAVFFAMDSQLEAHLSFSVNGQVVDQIFVRTVIDASAMQPSIHQRMNKAGAHLARLGAEYVRRAQRAGG